MVRKETVFIASLIGACSLVLVPVYAVPKYMPNLFNDIQKETRKDMDREKIQPGDMKMWSDPFDRKK